MRGYTNKTSKLALTCDKGEHGIFHSSITALNHGILFPGIRSYIFIEKPQKFFGLWLKVFPVFLDRRIFLVKEMKRGTVISHPFIMNIFRICCPCEIMHLWSNKMPGKFLSPGAVYFCAIFFIPISNFIWILQVTRASKDIIFVYGYLYIKLSPYPVKFSSNIRVGMPAFKIIFRHFRIPLAHR